MSLKIAEVLWEYAGLEPWFTEKPTSMSHSPLLYYPFQSNFGNRTSDLGISQFRYNHLKHPRVLRNFLVSSILATSLGIKRAGQQSQINQEPSEVIHKRAFSFFQDVFSNFTPTIL